MNIQQICDIQRKVGAAPDGFWGPLSMAACQKYLKSLMPNPNPWPSSDEASLLAFYGRAGDESQLVSMQVPFGVEMYYEDTQVTTIRCHRKVAASLSRALSAAYKTTPAVVSVYDGCYNNRNVRGGKIPSLHARGAAIDLDAENNGNQTHWPARALMPFSVMEAFAREGWTSAGAFWSRDAMHFQATKPS